MELSNNNITHLNDSVLTMLNKTSCTNITLGNNPWTCDCTVINFINFLVSSNIHRKQVSISLHLLFNFNIINENCTR